MPPSAANAVQASRNRTDVRIRLPSLDSADGIAARIETRAGGAPEIGRLLFHLGTVLANLRALGRNGTGLRLLIGRRLRRRAGRAAEQAADQQAGTSAARPRNRGAKNRSGNRANRRARAQIG